MILCLRGESTDVVNLSSRLFNRLLPYIRPGQIFNSTALSRLFYVFVPGGLRFERRLFSIYGQIEERAHAVETTY